MMLSLHELWMRWRGMFRGRGVDRDIEDELQFHQAMRQREFEEHGMNPADASVAARRRFGSETAVRETGRDIFRFGGLDRLWQDLRHGWRLLAKSPGFTTVAVLSLAIGIAGNATIFSVIHAVLLQPPPYQKPEELVTIWSSDLGRGGIRGMVAYADILDFERDGKTLANVGIAGGGYAETVFQAGEAPEIVRWQYVSPNLTQVLGVSPLAGTDLNRPELYRSSRGVLLSYEFWQRRFAGDINIISLPVTINGKPAVIAGVMPKGFQILAGGRGADVWQALNPESSEQTIRGIPWLVGIGRLGAGKNLAEVQAELSGLAKGLEQTYPATNRNRGVFVETFTGQDRSLREVLIPLAGAVAFVLLLACANVANLLLAKAGHRRAEFALRASLGAGRARLIRQLLTESLLLAILGGVLGIGLTVVGIQVFRYLAPAWFPSFVEIGINGPVLLFAVAASMLAGVLAGVAPAMQASKINLNDPLREGTRASSSGRQKKLRAVLVAVQIGLALVLVTGAGLMLNSLARVLQVKTGYDATQLMVMQINFADAEYSKVEMREGLSVRHVDPRLQAAYDRILERVNGLPGVESASLVAWVPQAGNNRGPRIRRFTITGQGAAQGADQPSGVFNMVAAEYFRTMRIPVIRGRVLGEKDSAGGQWVAVINESAAKRYWPQGNAIGQLITIQTVGSNSEERPRTVVGIVGDVRQGSLTREPMPEIYTPYSQQPGIYGDGWQILLHRNLVVRTSGEPELLANAVRAEVAAIDKSQIAYDAQTMESIQAQSAGHWRFFSRLLSFFSAIALFLAAIGIYGVLSYAISERTYEFGIRLALGGTPASIWNIVFRYGLLLTGGGLIAGIAVSAAAAPVLSSLLYGVRPHDAATFTLAAGLILAVAALATIVPARRAMRVDPAKALHAD